MTDDQILEASDIVLQLKKTGKHDWGRFDALTDEEVHAAALADPDALPAECAALFRPTIARYAR